MKGRELGVVTAVVISATALIPARTDAAAQGENPRIVVAAQAGNLQRLKLVEDDLARIQGEYPMEDLKFSRTGSASVAFRLSSDGHIIDPIPGLRTSDVFYQAALKVMRQLKMAYVEGSWSGPINRFVADVAFRVPPCVAEAPRLNIDLQLTVCAALDAAAELTWKERSLTTPADSPTLAQAKTNCESPGTTLEINECLQAQVKRVEAQLNATYQRVMRELSKPDVPGHVHFAEAKKNLIEAQRAWLRYREKDCHAVYALAVGASMRGQLSLQCIRNRTEQRTKQLEQLLEP